MAVTLRVFVIVGGPFDIFSNLWPPFLVLFYHLVQRGTHLFRLTRSSSIIAIWRMSCSLRAAAASWNRRCSSCFWSSTLGTLLLWHEKHVTCSWYKRHTSL